jgi:hypothetical protein
MPKQPATKTTSGDLLSRRALNRATLERQLLLHRSKLSVTAAIERLVGMQAQAPLPPYYGLWTRLENFRPVELARLLTDREVVRIVLMRGTVHLVSARDCLMLHPLVLPVLQRGLNGNYGRRLVSVDIDQVVATARALVEEQPRTNADLRALLGARWPDADAEAIAQAARYLLPLVQLPPRGIWGAGGQPVLTTAEKWLGRPLDPDPSPDELVLRYLAAFGPATVADMRAWSGLNGLRDVTERLRPRLCSFRDEQGRELFDLPEAPRPDPDTLAPVRFLPEWDNLLLSHADRTRVITDDYRRRAFTNNGIIPGTILVDGFVRGAWKIVRVRNSATLTIEPYEPIAASDRESLEEEGLRLLDFAAEEAGTKDVRFV